MTGPSRLRIVCAALLLLAVAGSGAGLLALRGTAREQEVAGKEAGEAGKPAEAARRPPREVLRYGGKDFDEWRSVLRTELKPETRVEAIKALCAFGVNGYGREATAAIVEVLRGYEISASDQDDIKVVDAAQHGLGKIGAEAVPVLLDELKKGGKNGRWFALYVLSVMGGQAQAAVPVVTKAIKDEDPAIRIAALDALASIDPEGTSVGAVAAPVTDEDVSVRQHAINLLAQWGPKARTATPQLLAAAVKDDNVECRRQALKALQAIEPPAGELVPTLAEAIKDKDLEVRQVAFVLLTQLGPEAKEAVPVLIHEFQSPDNFSLRPSILRVLEKMGPAAKAAVPALTESLKREAPGSSLYDAVRQALEKIDP